MAMEGGRHIFVEKPMVARWEDALTLKNKIDLYNGIFFVNKWLENEGFLKTKNVPLAEGAIPTRTQQARIEKEKQMKKSFYMSPLIRKILYSKALYRAARFFYRKFAFRFLAFK